MTRVARAVALVLLAVGCDDAEAPPTSAAPPSDVLRLTTVVDVPQEAYVCVEIPAPSLAGAWVRGVRWSPPAGAVLLHHASLFAVAREGPLGPMPCETAGLAPLGVYTPGTSRVGLPPDVGVRMGPATRLVMLAHAIRTGPGAAQETAIELELAPTPPAHGAGWIDVFGEVPALAPHQSATTNGTCTLGAEAHAVTVWPHMHRSGYAFEGVVHRADGTVETLVSLPQWDFGHQLTYPADTQLHAGDVVEVRCTYLNQTEDFVVPGLLTENEMCVLGLFVWPETAATCASKTP